MIVLWLISSLFAATLELKQVHQLVLKDLPLILEAEAKVKAAQGLLQGQEGAFDHKIKVKTMNQFENKYDNQVMDTRLERQTPWLGSRMFVGHKLGTGNFPDYYGEKVTSSVGELYAGIEIPLLRDREMDEFRLQRVRASRGLDLARVQVTQKSLEVLLKSAQVYWKWVASGQKLRVVKAWVKTAEERQSFLERKVKAGDTSEIKLTDNQRSLLKRKSEVVKAERDFQQVSQELSLYIQRQPMLEEVPQEIPVTAEAMGDVSKTQRDQLPVFRLISIEKEILEVEREMGIAQSLPALNLGLEGSRDVSGGGLPLDRKDPDQLRVGLNIEIPLENRKGRGKLREARGKIKALEQRQEWLEREWATFIAQNRVGLKTTREQLELIESELSATIRMAQAEVGRLNQGDGDVFFVNIREQDEAEARIRLIETKAMHEFLISERFALDGTWLSLIP